MSNKHKIILRCFLFFIPFLSSIFGLCAMLLFPLTLVLLMAFCGLITYPFILLLKIAGGKVSYIEPFMGDKEKPLLGYIAILTIFIWFPFYYTYNFIKTGELSLD